MSKIAEYLNEHIVGEITSNKTIRQKFSRDASILTMTPELVMFPRATNDIRKAARFSWQLAEKGHVLPLTVRGGGSDQTGAAIGKGIIINTTAHLNNIIHLALKDKDHFVHVQPGVTFQAVNDALVWHGLQIPSFPESASYSTIGGAVANNAGGVYGLTGDYVSRLEVVLANGDLIETSRISKHELSKKKGLQTFEGELYRKVEGLIEDNQAIIDKIATDQPDNAGFHGLAKVKAHDGSFDLTPLLIGSQGTLGIISEIVLKSDFVSRETSILVAVLPGIEAARDAALHLQSLQPSILETYDGDLFNQASSTGKTYTIFQDIADVSSVGAVLYLQANDFSDRARVHTLKRALKILAKYQPVLTATSDDYAAEELQAIRGVYSTLLLPETTGESLPPLFDGASVPSDHHEAFSKALSELAAKHHVSLPLRTNWLTHVVTARPQLSLDKVSDKQKLFKLTNDYAALVTTHGGSFIAQSGEGRIKSIAAYSQLDDDTKNLFVQLRAIFDPYGTLNGGVKQEVELTSLVAALRSSYDLADFAQYSPHI